MKTKDQLRKKFLAQRQKKYFDVSNKKLFKLINFIKKNNKLKKNIFIAIYYPSNYEFDVLKIISYF